MNQPECGQHRGGSKILLGAERTDHLLVDVLADDVERTPLLSSCGTLGG